MTDQTQTTTEPVAWRYRWTDGGDVRWDYSVSKFAMTEAKRRDPSSFVCEPLYTTPQPLAIGLDRAGEAVIDAALRQLSMMGKGRDPSPRLREAIDNFRVLALAAPAEVNEPKWLVHARTVLAAYECDLGEPLDDMHELGRIPESRAAPSFRIRVGHIRPAAPTGGRS